MKYWIIKKLGGYIDWKDALENVQPEQKQEVLSQAVKHLYKCIDPDDILKQNPDGSYNFMGRTLIPSEYANLRNEAASFRNMKLWKVLRMDVKYQIGKKTWEEAGNKDDILWGKLITWMWDVVDTRIKQLTK